MLFYSRFVDQQCKGEAFISDNKKKSPLRGSFSEKSYNS